MLQKLLDAKISTESRKSCPASWVELIGFAYIDSYLRLWKGFGHWNTSITMVSRWFPIMKVSFDWLRSKCLPVRILTPIQNAIGYFLRPSNKSQKSIRCSKEKFWTLSIGVRSSTFQEKICSLPDFIISVLFSLSLFKQFFTTVQWCEPRFERSQIVYRPKEKFWTLLIGVRSCIFQEKVCSLPDLFISVRFSV